MHMQAPQLIFSSLIKCMRCILSQMCQLPAPRSHLVLSHRAAHLASHEPAQLAPSTDQTTAKTYTAAPRCQNYDPRPPLNECDLTEKEDENHGIVAKYFAGSSSRVFALDMMFSDVTFPA